MSRRYTKFIVAFIVLIPYSGSQYQLALFQIDSMRQDGKFIGVDGTIPEGQGILMAHLNECHELVEMVGFVIVSLFTLLLIPI